jgi:hypothetical protein
MSIRDNEHYDNSSDMIERIRRLREAAERKMNTFGDPADYDVRIIRGHNGQASADRQMTLPLEAIDETRFAS